MKRVRTATIERACLVLLLPIVLLLAACGGPDPGASGGDGGGGVGAPAGPAGSEDVMMQEDSSRSAAPEADVASSGGSEAAADGDALALSDGWGSKIVRTADIGLRAEDVRGVAGAAQRVAANNGGSVLVSEISGSDDQVSAYMTLSVPSEEFEGALASLRELGKKVVHDTVSGQDVTEEFVDLESRERNLLAAERSLLELYGRVETVEDTLTIERELTNVRGEIERVQGRLQYLENRTSFSQITVSVEPVAAPQPQPPGWRPAAVAAEAWSASLAVLRGIASAAIVAVAFGWWILPLLVGGYVFWRRRRAPSPTEV